ncbi:hypothetical protein KBC79_04845 [Candidatus Woesebacteria bacterium]|nr:hypothetical protein [Candidatus Woesebacteria bacterium]
MLEQEKQGQGEPFSSVDTMPDKTQQSHERQLSSNDLRQLIQDLKVEIGVDEAATEKFVKRLEESGYVWMVVDPNNNLRIDTDLTIAFYENGVMDRGLGLSENQTFHHGKLKATASFVPQKPLPTYHYGDDDDRGYTPTAGLYDQLSKNRW